MNTNEIFAMSEEIIRLKDQRHDLLYALKRMLEECIIPSHRISDVEKVARAAVAKAEGEA